MGSGPSRYEKDQLLGIYAPSQPVEASSHLFVSGWNPDQANGNMTRNWGKSNDNYVPQEPGACWDSSGDTLPIGLQQLSIDEKEVSARHAGTVHMCWNHADRLSRHSRQISIPR